MLRGRILKRGLAIAAVFAATLLLGRTPVMAADSVTATIPVSQTYSEKNKIPSDLNRTFKYLFKAEDSSNPMPSESTNGSYSFSLSSTASKKLTITYTNTGVYKYTLKQSIPDKKISRMTYDDRIYNITVSVKKSGSGLVTEIYINENGTSYKTDSAKFENSYNGKKSSSGSSSSSSSSSSGTSSYASSGTGTTDSGVLGDREGPNTGDSARPAFWIAIMAASALAMVFILLGLKKRRI